MHKDHLIENFDTKVIVTFIKYTAFSLQSYGKVIYLIFMTVRLI